MNEEGAILETTNEEVTMLSDGSGEEEEEENEDSNLDQSAESGTYLNGNDLSASDFQFVEKDNYKEQETFLKMQDENDDNNNDNKDIEINEDDYDEDVILPSQTIISAPITKNPSTKTTTTTTTTSSSNTTSTPTSSVIVMSSEDPPHISFTLSPRQKPFNYDDDEDNNENKNNNGNILSLDDNKEIHNNYYERYRNNINPQTFGDAMLENDNEYKFDQEIHINDDIYSIPDIPDPIYQEPTNKTTTTTTTTTTSTSSTKTNLTIDSNSKEFNLFSSPIQLNKTKIIVKNKILFKCRFILTKISKPLDLKEKKHQLRIQQLAYVLLENRGKIQFIRGGRIILHLRVHKQNTFNKEYIVSDKFDDLIHVCENKLTFYIQYM